MTEDELRSLGYVEPGRQRALYGAEQCIWQRGGLSGDDRLSLYIDVTNDVLGNTFRTWQGVLVPIEIDGLPAARTKIGRGEGNFCMVTTGIAERQTLETSWTARGDPAPGNDACEFAEQAATLVVRKLPPA